MRFRTWLTEAEYKAHMLRPIPQYPTYPEDIAPIRQGEQFRVFHGFRDIADALTIAKYGTSGKLRAKRVYSYESDNNPKGMFVSLNLKKIASQFAGGSSHGVVMEFIANQDELEPPTWPGDSYTVQGQMAPYFYQHPLGARMGRVAKQKEDEEEARQSRYQSISQSSKPGLARTLFGGEMQALFVGDLNPEDIVRFWFQEPDEGVDYRRTNSEWKPLTREAFLQKFDQEQFQSKNPADRHASYRALSPRQDWNWQTVAQWFNEKFRAKSDAPLQTEKDVYDEFAGALTYGGVKKLMMEPRGIERVFGQYLWPRQLPQFYKWLKQMYNQHGEPRS